MSTLWERPDAPAVGQAVPHESAIGHVTGAALFTDDLIGRLTGVLHAFPVRSAHTHALVTRLEVAPALGVPGVVRVLTAADVPGVNDAGEHHDEPLFPTEVMFRGHAVAWVLADSLEAAKAGAASVVVEYSPLPAIVTIADAEAAGSFQGEAPVVRRGDAAAAMATASHIFSGELEIGGQEHFYLETHAALATVDEAGQIFVQSSTQHPTETQDVVAHVLGLPANAVTVQCLRMGGGFGGKEWQPHGLAAIAALGAVLTGRPVRLRLERASDLVMTGKRHPFLARWEAGFDDDGLLVALRGDLISDGGWCLDLSAPVLARALTHCENAYWVPNVEVRGRIAKTHKTSQTAFRGFGGPQGMLFVEDALGRCASELGIAPEELRRRNLYRPGQTTPYGQPVKQAERLELVWSEALAGSGFARRRAEVDTFNAAHAHVKRGLAITPEKFGISFNHSAFNQAGALVHLYKDGSVLINHGGTEMGQGLHTKMVQVAATALGVPLSVVRLAPTRTDKVPNTSATAASSGADLNGAAVKNACDQLRARLANVAAGWLSETTVPLWNVPVQPDDVRFAEGLVYPVGHPELAKPFAEVVNAAYWSRVHLSAAGYYRTQGLHWDANTMTGEPFKYFSFGAAVCEVEVDGFTGAHRLLRADIVIDVGDSLSPLIDRGQIEGGFVQGVGWLTMEDLRWDSSDGDGRGRLLTASASTYKLPSLGELPGEFNVTLLKNATETGAIYGSKAVGEPPLTLAIAAREALRDAASAFGPPSRGQHLACPATPEAVYWALTEARSAGVESAAVAPSPVEPAPAPAPVVRPVRRRGAGRKSGTASHSTR